MTLLPDLQPNCEILWAEVQIPASKSLTLGCFSPKLVLKKTCEIFRPDAEKIKSDHCPGR